MRSLVDSFVALAVLIIASPLLLLIGVAIVIESGWSPFYLAPRVGRGGEPFRMWKFRTMVTGASRFGPPITGKNDPRITRVGKVLRETKLDELPQFVNVLVGDMSLVGPRPETPEIVAMYTPAQRMVLGVKPGITGPSQLASREESDSIPENVKADEYYLDHIMAGKLKADMDYLDQRSVVNDLQILVGTAVYVLRRCGRRIAIVLGH